MAGGAPRRFCCFTATASNLAWGAARRTLAGEMPDPRLTPVQRLPAIGTHRRTSRSQEPAVRRAVPSTLLLRANQHGLSRIGTIGNVGNSRKPNLFQNPFHVLDCPPV